MNGFNFLYPLYSFYQRFLSGVGKIKDGMNLLIDIDKVSSLDDLNILLTSFFIIFNILFKI